MADTLELLAEKLKVQEAANSKVWDTLEKLLTAVNEIKISLTHLEVLSKKDAEQDDKLNHLKEELLQLERVFHQLKSEMKDKARDIQTELKIWRYGVIFTVSLLISVIAGNFEFVKSLF